ncbi:cytochrome c biogenesis protein CcdA [Streptomyces sp. H10-C2]|uniref:cytochrome c biogenesis CcdA family protein n=1 Tax=unclassified Streptomyces TaxID=2593676 RepID=UPI0024B92D5B|nr:MULTISPECIES: cytochrome c biogenesis protein CcdA [unclassified Streptomyces]MDJ0346596.1 cytochrome c biogenesis protein CcdA [Streptomyces sp. PH10-H1]MDJ0375031.1 cytochrome c biogenesis protein CcdA [Streptomyces sp. H10-C2]
MGTGGVGYLAAFGGGLVSFLSPCVLPIVPAYLSLITGLSVQELAEGGRLHLGRVVRTTGGFISGFSAVFIALGMSATVLGHSLIHHQVLLTRVSGLVVLAMALFLAAALVLSRPWLQGEIRWHPQLSKFGPLAAPVAGIAFGFGWTPCIGPVLASVLALAATQHGAATGGLLLATYSLGLGVPFLAVGLLYGRLLGVLGWVRRHAFAITLTSTLLMAGFGVLLTLDRLIWVTSQLQNLARALGLGRLVVLG